MNFPLKPDFSIKIEFQNWVSGKNFFPRIRLSEMFCIRNLPERKILNSKPDILDFFLFKFSLCRKTFASESDSFFSENFISNSYFQRKICYKVMPLKWARKVKNLLLSAEQTESKRYFLDVMFLSKSDSSIKIELEI